MLQPGMNGSIPSDKQSAFVKMDNLLVKEFNGEIHLSTTSKTSLEVQDVPPEEVLTKTNEAQKSPYENVLLEEFSSVKEVVFNNKCPVCMKSSKAEDGSVFHCLQCGSATRKTNITPLVLVSVLVKEMDKDIFTFNAKDLESYLCYNPTSFSVNKTKLIDDILNLVDIEAKVNREKKWIELAPNTIDDKVNQLSTNAAGDSEVNESVLLSSEA